MRRAIVTPLLYIVVLPAALAACGYVEIVPHDTSGGTGGGPAVPETGGGPAVPETGGGPAVPETGGGPAVPETGGAGAGGEYAASTGAGGAPPDPTPAPSCSAAECAVRIAEGAPKCAASASGKAFCWWDGFVLGTRLAAPVELPGLDDIVAASGLLEAMCFLHAGGRVSCLGLSHYGQLGQAVPVGGSSAEPLELPGVEGIVQLSSGHHHVCGVLGSGKVVCWGGPSPAPVLGVEHVDDVYGIGVTQVPVTVTGVDDAVQVAANIDHTCALRATGEVACWGWLTSGGEAVTAVGVEGVEGAVEISAGSAHDCARLASGEVLCWSNRYQRDDGARGPQQVPGLDDAIQVSAGYNRTCALRQGGRVVCWWASANATLSEIDIGEAVHVSVGYEEACAALASGEIACWPHHASSRSDVRVFGL
ncbi:RCC1 domain-containing protein [Sorangium sp. So ce394]|uniref:RCC1 domain-containing protein n=1 Tax=Sorangium sp. So ce394 TaxID=3133310 RepID=UPI003F5BCA05